MSKIALVTDSTANIPKQFVDQYQIRVAPQVLIWGDENLLDGVDIQPSEFYTRLEKTSIMPTTSQAVPAAFHKIYSELLAAGCEIMTIVISEKLSGTIVSARQARDMFPGAPIEIMDSYSAAMGLGFQVIAAARAASQGASLAECKAVAERARDQSGVVFAVDTLEFLYRGGRIGGATRFLGTALKLKPILEIRDGRVDAVERVRTRSRSLGRVLELVEERINGRSPVHLASLHANAPQDAQELLSLASQRFNTVEAIITEVSPVVGNHAGPGTVGMCYLVGM